MRKVNVGLIGYGTVGSGVAESLVRRKSILRSKTGAEIELKVVCDKDIKTRRHFRLPKGILTTDLSRVLEDPDIDIVVELVGGIHPAREIIKNALANGKYVVTANKALLCEHGKELFGFAGASNRCIRFEGSVGGGIPIIKSLKESLVANNIQAIYGIVNGTSNYILSRMQTEGTDFKRALEDAKRLGVAEKDATLDVSGTDSAHKLALLALLGFGKNVSLGDIYVEGIAGIEPCDIALARGLGYCIKLLAITKRTGNDIELRVHPTLVDEGHPLSAVKGIFNAIFVKGDYVGESLFYGQGAGRYPTASSVVADIVDIASGIGRDRRECDCKVYFDSGVRRIRPIKEIVCRYYVRIQATDRPGVLAAIAGVFARHNISIASVKQVDRSTKRVVPIVMLTHDVEESSMQIALKKIGALGSIKSRPVAIRIEQL